MRLLIQTYSSRAWVIAIYELDEHYLLFSKLRVVHMSGDEAESEEARRKGVYVIIEAEWQSEDFKIFVRSLDQRYLNDWDKGVGNRKRGRPPRQRNTSPSKPCIVVDQGGVILAWCLPDVFSHDRQASDEHCREPHLT